MTSMVDVQECLAGALEEKLQTVIVAIALAGSWSTDEPVGEPPTTNNRIVIPKAWIKKRKVVKL